MNDLDRAPTTSPSRPVGNPPGRGERDRGKQKEMAAVSCSTSNKPLVTEGPSRESGFGTGTALAYVLICLLASGGNAGRIEVGRAMTSRHLSNSKGIKP